MSPLERRPADGFPTAPLLLSGKERIRLRKAQFAAQEEAARQREEAAGRRRGDGKARLSEYVARAAELRAAGRR